MVYIKCEPKQPNKRQRTEINMTFIWGVPVHDIKIGDCCTTGEHEISGRMFLVEQTVNSDYDTLIST